MGIFMEEQCYQDPLQCPGTPDSSPELWPYPQSLLERTSSYGRCIASQLVSWVNPEGLVTDSDLELVGSVVHHAFMTDCFNIREQTMLYQTDNTEGL